MSGEVVGAVDAGGTSTAPPFTIPDTMAKDLVAAWAELSNVAKSRQAHQYMYADLADVLDVVRPVLARHNLAVIQPLSRQGGPVITIHTMLIHSSGHVLEWEYDVQVGSNAQETGSALTNGRRYALSAVLGVAAGGDDDGAEASSATAQPE